MFLKCHQDWKWQQDSGPKECKQKTWKYFIFPGPIISPPYPEVTLDTFGFPVDGRLAARRAVSWPRLPKVALFGPKSGFFGQKSIFCPHPPIFSLPSWPDTKKTTFLCRSCCWTSSWGAARAHFWPKNSPKIRFFCATPIKSLFFGLRRTWLNEIITSTYPEVRAVPTQNSFCQRRRHGLVARFSWIIGKKTHIFADFATWCNLNMCPINLSTFLVGKMQEMLLNNDSK